MKIPLPPTFFKEPTVELKDIKERLDEGLELSAERTMTRMEK